MTEITSRLQDEHRHILGILDLIDHELEIASDGSEPNLGLLSDILGYIKGYHDDFHHPLEELVFDGLLQHDELHAVVEFLRHEHTELEDITEQFRDAAEQLETDNSDQARRQFLSSGSAYVVAQRNHMAAEENSIFPYAETLFTEEEWKEISAHVAAAARATDPIYGLGTTSKFHLIWEQLERHT